MVKQIEIGNWVARYWRYRRTTLWHRVESMISGAAITNCGRRLEPRATTGQLRALDTSLDFLPQTALCAECS